jgi:large subunit ribosomal protein L15
LDRIEGNIVDRDSLIKCGLVRSSSKLVKLLGDGECERSFTVQLDKVSAAAREKIEKTGGNVVEATNDSSV